MLGKVEKTFVVLVCASLVALAVSVGATEYNPGVQVGYWVEYGNFVTRGLDDSENFNETKWMKMEVTRVVGNRVTVHISRTFKNDTFEDGSDCVFDVATNETDRSANGTNLWNNYAMVAGNLTETSDTHLILIIPEGFSLRPAAMFINKTETKDLLGMYRTVNLVDYYYSNSTYYYDYRFYAAYDQTTGMLLELNYSLTSQISPDTNEEFSFSATDLNTKLTSSDKTLIYAEVVIAVVIVVIIAAAFVVRRRRKAHAVGFVRKVAKKNARK